jgi:hypothetical protein
MVFIPLVFLRMCLCISKDAADDVEWPFNTYVMPAPLGLSKFRRNNCCDNGIQFTFAMQCGLNSRAY